MIYVKKLKIIKDFHLSLDVRSNTLADTQIFVHSGDIVTQDTLVAKIFRSAYTTSVDLAKELEIKSLKNPQDIMGFIDVLEGQIVQKGRIIAHKSFLGIENIIKAPFDGVIHVDVSEHPTLIIQSLPVEIEVKALTKGRIVDADKEKVTIATNVIRLFPYFVHGKSVYGELKNLDNIESLDQKYKDTIIFYNAPISLEMVRRAMAVSAIGIMGPSCPSRILSMPDKNFTVISFEGFGSIEMPIYEKIHMSEGYVVWVNAAKEEVIIGTKLTIEDLKEAYIKDISFNDQVQVFDNAHYGNLARVKEIHGDRIQISLPGGKEIDVNSINITGILS